MLQASEPSDREEQEATRIAEQVVATPVPSAIRSAPPSIPKRTSVAEGWSGTVPESVEKVLDGSGKPLDAALQRDMEQRFGQVFSHVRVHAGDAAEQSARDLEADAFTLGSHIVFAAGKFAPSSQQGRRLIADEFTHVVQQNAKQTPLMYRQKAAKPSQEAAQEQYYVIGDPNLNHGGGVEPKDLESLRKSLLATSPKGGWTLSMTMHGSEKFVGLSAGDVAGGITEIDPNAYNESRIKAVFGDKDFRLGVKHMVQ